MGSLHLRRSAVGVVALVVALLVTGCEQEDSSGPIAPTGEPLAPQTSTTSEPTVGGSSAPNLSPIETVRAWVKAYNTALRSGDTSDLADAAGPECKTCTELQKSVEEVHSSGGSFRGGAWGVDAAKVTGRSANAVLVTAGITVAAGESQADGDAEPEPYPEDKFVIEFEVGLQGDRRVVTQMVFLS